MTDVEVVETPQSQHIIHTPKENTLTITLPALALPVTQSVQIRLTRVEIRGAADNKLITILEMLSLCQQTRTRSVNLLVRIDNDFAAQMYICLNLTCSGVVTVPFLRFACQSSGTVLLCTELSLSRLRFGRSNYRTHFPSFLFLCDRLT